MGHRDRATQGRRWPCAMEAEIGLMHLQAKKHWGLLANTRNEEKQGSTLPDSFQRERGPADTWISNFWPLELSDNKFLLFLTSQFVILCFGSPGKLILYPNPNIMLKGKSIISFSFISVKCSQENMFSSIVLFWSITYGLSPNISCI